MPRSLPFGVVVAAMILQLAFVATADEPKGSQGASGASELPPLKEQFRRPELVAMAWASTKVGSKAETAVEEGLAAWRPDGGAIDAAELKFLKEELPAFGSRKPHVDVQSLPPLHFVFRLDERAVNSQRVGPSLIVGERRVASQASQEGSSAHRLALAVMAPSPMDIREWPAVIDLELRVPIDEGQVFRTLQTLDDRPMEVAPGARLSWTAVPAADNSGRMVPAVLMEIDPEQTTLVDYDFVTHRKDGSAESLNARRMVRDHEVLVSPSLESRDELERIDVSRLRYRAEIFEKLSIFPERMGK